MSSLCPAHPQALASKERALGPEPPATLKAAKKALAAAQKAAAAAAEAEPEEDAVEARYGNPKSKATAAIDRALRSGGWRAAGRACEVVCE